MEMHLKWQLDWFAQIVMHLKGGINAFTLHLQLYKYYKIVFKKKSFFLSNGRILKMKFFKCETKIDSRWWQVFVLMSKSLNHSINQFLQNRRFIKKQMLW